ncbi:MAG: hypothetical protein K6E19_02740 [Lachnospiraceae bacterium]|nr:hypothetical protein [Lachnospiraceae bacterium]
MDSEASMSADRGFIISLSVIGVAGIGIIFLIISLLFGRGDASIDLRLQRKAGSVSLYDTKGKERAINEDVRLRSGQSIGTKEDSLVMVALDDSKHITLDECSLAEVRSDGGKFELNLVEGNLFFNVNRKLAEDEAFAISTETMVCRIRGTSGYRGYDSAGNEILLVTDGIVEVSVIKDQTGENITETAAPGESITIVKDVDAEGNEVKSLVKGTFREEDLPAVALDAINKDPELSMRVTEATGFSEEKLEFLHKVFSTPGTSMVGSAAEDLKSTGISDSLPLMGSISETMVSIANRAADASGGSFSVEQAILTGARTTIDQAVDSGYSKESVASLSTETIDCAIALTDKAAEAGLEEEELVTVVNTVTDTINETVVYMSKDDYESGLVSDTVGTIESAISEAIETASNVGGDEVLLSVSNVSHELKETLTEVKKEALAEDSLTSEVNSASDSLTASEEPEESSKETRSDKNETSVSVFRTTSAGITSDAGSEVMESEVLTDASGSKPESESADETGASVEPYPIVLEAVNCSVTFMIGEEIIESAKAGDVVSVLIVPGAEDYVMDGEILITDADGRVIPFDAETVSFTMPESAVTVSVKFKAAVEVPDQNGSDTDNSSEDVTGISDSSSASAEGAENHEDTAGATDTSVENIDQSGDHKDSDDSAITGGND